MVLEDSLFTITIGVTIGIVAKVFLFFGQPSHHRNRYTPTISCESYLQKLIILIGEGENEANKKQVNDGSI
jgi:hypothetical protein